MDGVGKYLSPDQVDLLDEGWHVAVVLDPHDLDVMHSALTLPYCDEASKRLSDDIVRQIRQRHLLDRVGEFVDSLGAP